MLSLCSFLLVCMYLSPFASAVGDFEDDIYKYKFIYHETHKLLLTIQQTPATSAKCYFTSVDDSGARMLTSCHRSYIEGVLPQPSSLTAVRNTYADRLADYHCLDKEIFTLPVDFSSYLFLC